VGQLVAEEASLNARLGQIQSDLKVLKALQAALAEPAAPPTPAGSRPGTAPRGLFQRSSASDPLRPREALAADPLGPGEALAADPINPVGIDLNPGERNTLTPSSAPDNPGAADHEVRLRNLELKLDALIGSIETLKADIGANRDAGQP